jgi:hypothetical protein
VLPGKGVEASNFGSTPIVVRQCVDDATAAIASFDTRLLQSGALTRRRHQLRRATRTTPRHGSSYTGITTDETSRLSDAANLVARFATSQFVQPVSQARRFLRSSVPPGVAVGIQNHELARRVQIDTPGTDIGKELNPALDLEFELGPGDSLRAVSVRPWLSTLIGSDAEDEAEHRSHCMSVLESSCVPQELSVIFLHPSGEHASARRIAQRLKWLRAEAGQHAFQVVDPRALDSTSFVFTWDDEAGRVSMFARADGRRVHFALAAAYVLDAWPEWIRAMLLEQDRERLAISRMLFAPDRGVPGRKTVARSTDGVLIGRDSVRVGLDVPHEELLKAVSEVCDGGLVRVRSRNTDRAFVFDPAAELGLISDMKDIILESPPGPMADAYRSGRDLRYATTTVISGPSLSGAIAAVPSEKTLNVVEFDLGPSAAEWLNATSPAGREEIAISIISDQGVGLAAALRASGESTGDLPSGDLRVIRTWRVSDGDEQSQSRTGRAATVLLATGEASPLRALVIAVAALMLALPFNVRAQIESYLRSVARNAGRDLWNSVSQDPQFREKVASPPCWEDILSGTPFDEDQVWPLITEMISILVPRYAKVTEILGMLLRSLLFMNSTRGTVLA